MVLIAASGAVILGLAIMVQKKLVDEGWDPAPGRGVGDTGGAGTAEREVVGRSYPKITPPVGAPTPPAHIDFD